MSDVSILLLQMHLFVLCKSYSTAVMAVSTPGGSEFVYYVLQWARNGFTEIICATVDILNTSSCQVARHSV